MISQPISVGLNVLSSGPLINVVYSAHWLTSQVTTAQGKALIIRTTEHERITGLIQNGGAVSSGTLLQELDTQRNVIIASAATSIPGNNMGCVPDWQPYSVNE